MGVLHLLPLVPQSRAGASFSRTPPTKSLEALNDVLAKYGKRSNVKNPLLEP